MNNLELDTEAWERDPKWKLHAALVINAKQYEHSHGKYPNRFFVSDRHDWADIHAACELTWKVLGEFEVCTSDTLPMFSVLSDWKAQS